MGVGTMFGFGKKKKPSLPELPPPPSSLEMPMPEGDIPAIRPPSEIQEESELPEIPSFEPEEKEVELPEIPEPKMPKVPMPGEAILPESLEEIPSFEEKEFAPVSPKIEEVPEEEQVPIEEEMPVAERETVRPQVGPAFVSVDEYRNILEHSNRVREKLDEADGMVARLHEIKASEEKTFGKWRSQLEEIERKLGQIDKVISKAKR